MRPALPLFSTKRIRVSGVALYERECNGLKGKGFFLRTEFLEEKLRHLGGDLRCVLERSNYEYFKKLTLRAGHRPSSSLHRWHGSCAHWLANAARECVWQLRPPHRGGANLDGGYRRFLG